MNKVKINEIFERFSLNNPTPKIELKYQSPYHLLIAVLLSAQSTDRGVNAVTNKLFEIIKTPQDTVAMGLDTLKNWIKSIGLYNNKAKNIIALSQVLIDKYDCQVPEDFDALCSLPGIGRKSANVILNTVWQHKVIAVDTHVFRVSNRIKLCRAKSAGQTEAQLMKVVPDKWLYNAHHWLVLHGRYTCKARKPECAKCIINDLCEYKHKLL